MPNSYVFNEVYCADLCQLKSKNNRTEITKQLQFIKYKSKITNKFTLIELLVVIAVISILASMLLPALNAARNKARQIVCLSNQRQVGIATLSYMDSQNGYLPTSSKLGGSVPFSTVYAGLYENLWFNDKVVGLGLLYETGELKDYKLFWGCTEPISADGYRGKVSLNNSLYKYGWENWKINGKQVVNNYSLPFHWYSGDLAMAATFKTMKFNEYYPTDIRLQQTPRHAIIACYLFPPNMGNGIVGCHAYQGVNVFRGDGSAQWLKTEWNTPLGPREGWYFIFGWANAPHNMK